MRFPRKGFWEVVQRVRDMLTQLLAHESGPAPFEDDADFGGLVTTGAPRDRRRGNCRTRDKGESGESRYERT